MGIALPKWIVESQNNAYVIGVYGLVFGFLLPWFVVRLAIQNPSIPSPAFHLVSILIVLSYSTGKMVAWFKEIYEGSGPH